MGIAMRKLCYFINSDWYFDLHWIDRAIASRDAGYEIHIIGNDSNLLIVFYVQIMPDDFVMQLHR
ncbi:hypothetical protein QQX77_26890, partial [Klebsiella pneumoniae]